MRSHVVSAWRFVLFVASASVSLAGALAACGADGTSSSVGPGGGEAGVDAGTFSADAATERLIPADQTPSLVLVNGMIGGGKLAYDDVRVCLDAAPYPLPDAVPMPMSNYPGVGRGTGADLGAVSASVTLRVFRARDLRTDARWVANRVSCDSWAVTYPFTTLSVTPLGGPTLVVLVDDPTGPDGIRARTGALPANYRGVKDSLELVPAEFSTFAKAGQTLHVTVAGGAAGSGATGVLAASTFAFATAGGDVDAVKLRFERKDAQKIVTGSFEQTLGSVQFLSDPTTTPSAYFDRRTNFVLVLLGDETSPVPLDDKDLHFDGKGLHVVAIPYAAGGQ